MEAAKAAALEAIRSKPVVVFSKTYCPYCKNVKASLASLGVEGEDKLKVLELDNMSNGGEIQAALFEQTGQSTVPNIFIGGKHIGGDTDFTKKMKSKSEELQTLLKDAGAV